MNKLHNNIQRIYDELFERPNDPLSVKQLSELTGIPRDETIESISFMWDFDMVVHVRRGADEWEYLGVPKWRYFDQIHVERDRGDFLAAELARETGL